MRLKAAGVALATLVLLAASGAAAGQVPVHVGGDGTGDACGGLGQVSGRAVAVRAGPGIGFRAVDRLAAGRTLHVCEERRAWVGVIYGAACGVDRAMPRRMRYAGPCRSGWMHRRYVGLTAG